MHDNRRFVIRQLKQVNSSPLNLSTNPDEFPRLHRPSLQSREVMRMLRYRQKLIKMRTMSKNSLQSLALQSGIAKRGRLFTREGKAELEAAVMSPAMEWQRAHWWQRSI